MSLLLFYLILIIFVYTVHAEDSAPVVETSLGGIKGSFKTSFSGRTYEAYEGIPYALPPIKERRFQPPAPVQEWSGNISATKPSSACTQYTRQEVTIGDEDCLYLNVYVPSSHRTKQLPVLFIIHGGAFQYSSAYTGLKFLMDKDGIVVGINYRVGIMGFLSTEDDNVLGNMGLKDQSLALHWVSNHIHHFGGDTKRITLLGISAGAASVHYHYLSPWSKGLFQNGISFSGTSFAPGKQTENSREKAYKLASIVGCTNEDISKMVECLRYKPARLVAQAAKYFMPWLSNPLTPFGPVVEKVGNKPFIDRSPIEIISSGDAADVLWVAGFVSDEGLFPAAEFIANDEHLQELDKNWESLAPHILDYNFTIPWDKHAEVARKIRNYYLGTKPINKNTVNYLISLIGDRLYVTDGVKAAKLQAKMNQSPVLLWYYSYRALNSNSDTLSNTTNNWGVCHADDFFMLFENSVIYPPKNVDDRAMQIKLLDLIFSVAEKGHPDFGLGFEWKKVDPATKKLNLLHISSSNDIKMETVSDLGKENFWSSINFDENQIHRKKS